jgi:hypothetical protein
MGRGSTALDSWAEHYDGAIDRGALGSGLAVPPVM